MWFDARAKLAEIEGTPATTATTATNAPKVAIVAVVATHLRQKPKPATPARADDPDATTFRHGQAPNGRPVTWTGAVVSLAAWRDLTAWERDGPDGRHWSGVTQRWEPPSS